MATQTSSRPVGRSGGLSALIFGAILTLLAFAAFSVLGDGRDPPMRSVEIQVPTPPLPAPPTVIPSAEQPAP